MASYTSPRAPDGSVHGNYHHLPAPAHNGTYPPSQTLPSMAPSANGGNYGAPSAYGQPQPPYAHHQSPYQNHAPGHQQAPNQQAYQQPPPHPAQHHSQPSPTSAAPPQHPSSGPVEGTVGRLEAVSTVLDGRRYALVVEQQPIRARMCGFGDKDRRPLTPPPAIRLVVTDVNTGKEVDVNTIDYAYYVATVDLWDETGSKEVNLVRSTTATPAISSTIHESYNNLEAMPFRAANITTTFPQAHPNQMPLYSQPQPPINPYGQSQYGQVPSYSQAPNGGYGQSYGYPPSDYQPMYRPAQVFEPGQMAGSQRMSISGASSTGVGGMFTRNLIGNCAGSAFRLHDTNDKIGIWFVMQDLSVRTEGSFRLRFSFVDIKPRVDQKGNVPVKTGRSPILASVFSDVFQVYSAKKFPGVCDSTEISKCFANQGIKIPIRKEGAKGDKDDDDDDE